MRILITSALFLVCFCMAYSQDNRPSIQIIKYGKDANDTSNNSLDTIGINSMNKGDLFYVYVKDVNQYLYKIDIQYKDSTYASPLTIPSFTSLDLSTFKDLVTGLSSVVIGAKEQVTETASSADTMKTGTTFVNMATDDKTTCDAKLIATINNRIDLKKQSDIAAAIAVEGIKLDDLNREVSKHLIHAKLLNTDDTLPSPTFISTTLSSIKNIRTNTTAIQKSLTDYSKVIKVFEAEVAQCEKEKLPSVPPAALPKFTELKKKNITQLKGATTKVNSAIEASSKAVTELLSITSSDKTEALVTPLINIINNREKTYTSLPFMMMSDKIEMNISITPRNDSIMILPSYSTKVFFPKPSKRKIGIGSMFYISPVTQDERISFAPADSIGLKGVTEDPNRGEIGFSTNFTFGFSLNNNLALHTFVGPGISLSNTPRARGLIGVGASFGRNHNYTVNFGAIAGHYDRISKAVSETEIFITAPEQGTISTFGYSYFFSFGYLFSSNR